MYTFRMISFRMDWLDLLAVKTGQSVETQTLVGFMTNLVSIS